MRSRALATDRLRRLSAAAFGAAVAAAAPCLAQDAAQTDVWRLVRFMYLSKPPPDEAWVAATMRSHGQPKNKFAPDEPVIYQVFEIIPNTRTIVAIGNGAECTLPGSGANAKDEPALCPVDLMTVYADGRVNARRSMPGCFEWFDPSGVNVGQDPRTNNVYMRYDPQSQSVKIVAVANGKTVPACTASVHV